LFLRDLRQLGLPLLSLVNVQQCKIQNVAFQGVIYEESIIVSVHEVCVKVLKLLAHVWNGVRVNAVFGQSVELVYHMLLNLDFVSVEEHAHLCFAEPSFLIVETNVSI